tara:strand:+ start:86 stop:607 length:522 start_codon:yes stop_codon:yes gene_type:complete
MIISCINCLKKFDIDANLIPEKGRLLQCSKCNYKWFFKPELIDETIIKNELSKPNEETKIFEDKSNYIKTQSPKNVDFLEKQSKNDLIIDTETAEKKEKINSGIDLKNDTTKIKKNYSVLGLIIVFILSFIAIIIILDTFEGPISKVMPNIEFLLYSLYETINDIKLFLKDLI